MRHAVALLLLFVVPQFLFPHLYSDSSIEMIRSLSGPLGKLVGSKFILDEVRNRFIYPLDSSLFVYFECTAPKGDYVLTAYWKDPQGKTVFISPDLKMQTADDDLNSYWSFIIDSNRKKGVWTVELRINGEPVGFHSFELVMPELPKKVSPPAIPAAPTVDEIYRSKGKSLVWVHKLDGAGRRVDTSTGYVIAPDSILTAFQSIDTAVKIEMEFADRAVISTDEIISWNRLQDWAVIKGETGDIPALEFGKSDSINVGESAIVFSIGAGSSRIIGGIDISGRSEVSGFGERIYLNPQLPPQAVGGPLLDPYGRVIGLLGGSLTPGMRINTLKAAITGALAFRKGYLVSAIPIDKNKLRINSPAVKLDRLYNLGILTTPLSPTPVFKYGTVTDKIADDHSFTAKTQFSPSDSEIIVCTNWERTKQIKEGIISMNVFDASNRPRFKVEPYNLRLPKKGTYQNYYRFNPRNLEPGAYRIDLFWDGLPVWRSFISITD